jgi:NADPH-dependent 7-cyano-7-deazaguanine reductase QueF-like protein
MKTFKLYLNLHAQTVTETANYRRQSIVANRKTQVSKDKVIRNTLWKNLHGST